MITISAERDAANLLFALSDDELAVLRDRAESYGPLLLDCLTDDEVQQLRKKIRGDIAVGVQVVLP